MSLIQPRQLVAALKDWRVEIIEHDGWQSNTSAGSWNPHGVIHHHTAGSRKLLSDRATQLAMLRILGKTGRPDLPPPLCHAAPAYQPWRRRAVLHLLGWGNANHAGAGDSRVLRQIVADTYDGMRGTVEDHDGNPDFYGLEYLHPGDGTAWPDELIEIGVRTAAAICQAHGWKASSNLEHREWTDRKIDRSWKGDVRAEISRALKLGPRDYGFPRAHEAIKTVVVQDGEGVVALAHRIGATVPELLAANPSRWPPLKGGERVNRPRP